VVNVLQELQRWFAARCDGAWEHHHGIAIESCDNPGWWVKIQVAGTPLAEVPFPTVRQNVDEAGFQEGTDWLCCRVRGEVWHGAGDETKLEEILRTFLAWAKEADGGR
jgi:hypothetical protein